MKRTKISEIKPIFCFQLLNQFGIEPKSKFRTFYGVLSNPQYHCPRSTWRPCLRRGDGRRRFFSTIHQKNFITHRPMKTSHGLRDYCRKWPGMLGISQIFQRRVRQLRNRSRWAPRRMTINRFALNAPWNIFWAAAVLLLNSLWMLGWPIGMSRIGLKISPETAIIRIWNRANSCTFRSSFCAVWPQTPPKP